MSIFTESSEPLSWSKLRAPMIGAVIAGCALAPAQGHFTRTKSMLAPANASPAGFLGKLSDSSEFYQTSPWSGCRDRTKVKKGRVQKVDESLSVQ